MKSLRSIPFLMIAVAVLFVGPLHKATSDVSFEHQPEKNRVRVFIDGDLFTNYVVDEYPLPIMYPIYGPDGIRMNRQYPMEEGVEGESSDHPHHKSLMYSHGKFNGVDFWHQGGAETVHQEFQEIKDNYIKTRNKWVDENGNTILHDTRKITFQRVPDGRAIDFEITLHATNGDLNIGDTKEGTMSIRTHPNLRIDKGAHAINSNGTEGKPVWGEAAKWVHYSDKIDGQKVGVAIFDHPTNPRHPTTWHARGYGLITANPFGYSFFHGDSYNGSMKVHQNGNVTFSYRFLFIKGDHQDANIKQRYKRYTRSYKPSYVPEDYELQFNEHFVDEASIGQFVFSSPGDWSRVPIMNGARHALQQNKKGSSYKPPHRSPRNIGLVKTKRYDTFQLDFDAKQIGRKYGHRDACVFYNFVNPANYYYTHLGATRDEHAHQTFIVDDAPRTAITSNPNADRAMDWKDDWHHIRVERDADSGDIKIYVNNMDEPEMTANDTTHGAGYFGFGSFDDQAQFKNIQLYAPSAEEEAPDFFESKNPLSFQPNGGHFYHPQTVKIQQAYVDQGQYAVRYTTDGSAPTANAPRYDKPFRIKQNTTVNAAVFRNGKQVSSVRSASFKKLSEEEYKQQLRVSNLKSSSGNSYEVVKNDVEEGEELYTDRDYTYTDLPQLLTQEGVTLIRTANDDSGISGTAFQLDVNVPATVYVALDERTDKVPDWLSSYSKTDHVIETTDEPFRLYKTHVPSGTVTFGSNNAPSMYQVFLTKPEQ